MKFSDFKKLVAISREEICREIFQENRARIKVKKQDVAVKNLVKIFDATLSISNRKGFHAMSLRDLSGETGLSMGALYSYFGSKDELLDIIQGQGRRLASRVLTEQITGITGARERLRRALYSHLYLSEALHPWFYFSYMETKNLNREQQRSAIENELFTENMFSEILAEGCASGLFAVRDTHLVAAAIKALLQDWYLKRWKYSGRKTSIEEYARFIIDFIEAFVVRAKTRE